MVLSMSAAVLELDIPVVNNPRRMVPLENHGRLQRNVQEN
jgi:hypothetical protein